MWLLQSAFAVALINVEIPLLLGGLVNVLAKFTSHDGHSDFLQDMRLPAIKLVTMYSMQVRSYRLFLNRFHSFCTVACQLAVPQKIG